MLSNTALKRILYLVWLGGLLVVEYGWYQAWAGSMPVLSEMLVGVGSLFGLLATYLFLTQFILISGSKFIEARWGLDRLAGSHANNGQVAFYILLLHVAAVVVGYNIRQGGGASDIPLTYVEMGKTLPGVVFAAVALWIFVSIILSSIVMDVRKRLSYELWHFIHFATYLAVLLPIFHQLSLGATIAQPWFRTFWIALFSSSFGVIIWSKWLRPLLMYSYYRFEVDKVVDEADGVRSVYIRSKRLPKFSWQAGQFAFWWAPVKGLWYQPHPFTISSAQKEGVLRFTPKAIGSGSEAMQRLKPGDPMIIDGPYGRFTSVVSSGKKRLFIAGGIGITPIRAMLGEYTSADDVLVYGAQTKADLAFYDDIVKWVKKNKLSLQVVLSQGSMKAAKKGRITTEEIQSIAPDYLQRDIWICGPPPMMDAIETQLLEEGIDAGLIHTERFKL